MLRPEIIAPGATANAGRTVPSCTVTPLDADAGGAGGGVTGLAATLTEGAAVVDLTGESLTEEGAALGEEDPDAFFGDAAVPPAGLFLPAGLALATGDFLTALEADLDALSAGVGTDLAAVLPEDLTAVGFLADVADFTDGFALPAILVAAAAAVDFTAALALAGGFVDLDLAGVEAAAGFLLDLAIIQFILNGRSMDNA